ncbi:protein of unknown function [Vibrio tapetis subsp. tapetis]|uniref:Uncharacterized protein n=1 Tax=Vibrio tapetis subsp. tapetis TaxID=1671868 RepID=A0A2N8ZHH9_9VIBR|nr:protein of unknown function [Vibrio tapetis subsp. tapetis]
MKLRRSVGATKLRLNHYLKYCSSHIHNINASNNISPFFERKNPPPSMDKYLSTLPESLQRNSTKNQIAGFLKSVYSDTFFCRR